MSYYNSVVSNSEQEALKEMIFNRARERAKALSEDVQASYTTSVQSDIMEMARDSFVSNKNPFSIQETKKEDPKTTNNDSEIGFAKRQVNDVKNQFSQKSKTINSEIANKEVYSTMEGARSLYEKGTSFMGALDFLNSQASISLVKNKGKSFEALA